jgi:hypothetical protein
MTMSFSGSGAAYAAPGAFCPADTLAISGESIAEEQGKGTITLNRTAQPALTLF